MDKSKKTETLLVIVLGLVFLYWVKRWNGLLAAALVIGLAGLLFPVVATAIHWFWTKLSLLMGAVSGKVLLTIVYVVVLLPMALISRVMGKQTVRMKRGGNYWKDRNHTYTKADLEHPW